MRVYIYLCRSWMLLAVSCLAFFLFPQRLLCGRLVLKCPAFLLVLCVIECCFFILCGFVIFPTPSPFVSVTSLFVCLSSLSSRSDSFPDSPMSDRSDSFLSSAYASCVSSVLGFSVSLGNCFTDLSFSCLLDVFLSPGASYCSVFSASPFPAFVVLVVAFSRFSWVFFVLFFCCLSSEDDVFL